MGTSHESRVANAEARVANAEVEARSDPAVEVDQRCKQDDKRQARQAYQENRKEKPQAVRVLYDASTAQKY